MREALYNEIETFAVEWLGNLMAGGELSAGTVDARSIVDLKPRDLAGLTRCHFFAGIGGWDLALGLAGWPDGEPVWTGSCPCQPFSAAGKRVGFADERHLWPVWFRLIRECRPPVVFGEQVASADGLAWLDAVLADLEGAGMHIRLTPKSGAVRIGAREVRAMNNNILVSPVTYQGGKGRLAKEIVQRMAIPPQARFYDLCCGSGAVALAAVNAGHKPERIVMVDQGPWGLFWQSVSAGKFDLAVFRAYCDAVPKNLRDVKPYMEQLRATPVSQHGAYAFLLLQAAAFGGTPIAVDGDAWKRCGFRDYWLPTETSNRRSPVNPMMPMPETIYERAAVVVQRMRGITAVHGSAATVEIERESVVYIDPPYAGTTGYGHEIDVLAAVRNVVSCGAVCFVSEGMALSSNAVCLSRGRAKGGVTGKRKRPPNEEWLSRCDTFSIGAR